MVLAPSNASQLAQFVSSVSSPASPLYHHYLTEPQFVAQFGPPSWAVEETESWLRSDGLTVSAQSPFVISAVGTAGAASRAFGMQFGRYKTVDGCDRRPCFGIPAAPRRPRWGRGQRRRRPRHSGRPAGLLCEACLGTAGAPLVKVAAARVPDAATARGSWDRCRVAWGGGSACAVREPAGRVLSGDGGRRQRRRLYARRARDELRAERLGAERAGRSGGDGCAPRDKRQFLR